MKLLKLFEKTFRTFVLMYLHTMSCFEEDLLPVAHPSYGNTSSLAPSTVLLLVHLARAAHTSM